MASKKPLQHWSIATALQQIDACGFSCEAGHLSNADAYVWLKAAAEVGPKFWPGQGVWYEVSASAGGVSLSKWSHYYIVGVHMGSDTERRTWSYWLSNDPPAPWHYGEVNFTRVPEDKLRLEAPHD